MKKAGAPEGALRTAAIKCRHGIPAWRTLVRSSNTTGC